MSACTCINQVNEQLKPRGYRLSKLLSSLQLGANLDVVYHLPVERLDGKRLAAADPQNVQIRCCPFCGRPFEPKARRKKGEQPT